MKESYQRYRRHVATLLGVVFLASGLLKVEDPVGTMLIVTEYFKFLHLGFLIPLAKGIGIAVALTECAVGIGLVCGIFRKLLAIVTYALLGVFTLLTLALWIYNPAMDCGCFGQAIHLTHAQSFWKNVILLALAVISFTPFREFGKTKGHSTVAAIMAFAAVVFACVYSNRHLPMVEFTPYNWGSQLYASLDEDADESDFRSAPMLSFRNAEGDYLDAMAAAGKVVVFSVTDPATAQWEQVQEHYRAAEQAGALPLLLVASYPEQMQQYPLPEDIPVYYSDYKTLITLNRSNGGGAYFYSGELIHKWAGRDFPADLVAYLEEDPVVLSTRHITRRHVAAQGFCVGLVALLVLL